jgi:flavin reductase (DIM6/NTAB) family NADH-FMN oxidoreductase RutF
VTVLDDSLRHLFKTVMADVATPVVVATTVEDGVPHGTTVSSFSSLSLEPPMVLFALKASSSLLARIRSVGRFGINVLGAQQHGLAAAFAGSGDRFAGIPWEDRAGGARLAGVPVWLRCDVADLVPGGDHVVVLGRVVEADTRSGAPLTYHGRTYGTHVPHPA